MFLAVGVGAYSAAIFHLLTHAFFKALLFLGSGSVMHALHGELDIRKMGNLRAEAADDLLDLPGRRGRAGGHSARFPASSARMRSCGTPG